MEPQGKKSALLFMVFVVAVFLAAYITVTLIAKNS